MQLLAALLQLLESLYEPSFVRKGSILLGSLVLWCPFNCFTLKGGGVLPYMVKLVQEFLVVWRVYPYHSSVHGENDSLALFKK